MNRLQRLIAVPLLLAAACGLSGCIGFSGPNGVRNAIARQQNVKLEKQMGIDVGPLGIALANTFAAAYSPVTLDGLWSVSFGEYLIKPRGDGSLDEFRLDDVTLDDWRPFVRVREKGATVKLMHNARGNSINKMLFLTQTGPEVIIVQAEGDFNKIISNVLDSELLDDVGFLRDLEEPDSGEEEEMTIADAGPADASTVRSPPRIKHVGPASW